MALLWYILMLILSTVVHEFSHFKTAKHFGVTAKSFNMGMGTILYTKRTKDTDFNIRILPFGGSCEFDDGQLNSIKPFKRILVLAAGPISNLILAILFYQFATLAFCLERNFYDTVILIKVFFVSVLDFGVAGLQMIQSFFQTITQLFRLDFPTMVESGEILNEVVASKQSIWGIAYELLYLSSMLNLLLAVVNILPIPALDGGHITMTIPELFGKPINPKIYNIISYSFYILFLVLTGAFLAKDLIVTILHLS